MLALDAAAVRQWCGSAAEVLAAHRAEIDDLNVFPIPDGDTGTNMALTLRSAAEAVSDPVTGTAGVGGALTAMARGAVLGARGNSGVILAQILRGLAETCDGPEPCDGHRLATGLQHADRAAWAAVADPVEGTILSVVRAAAEAAGRESATGEATLTAVTAAASTAAAQALSRTTGQLAALAAAGVVDAGGRGLVLVLQSLAAVVAGVAPATADAPAASLAPAPSPAPDAPTVPAAARPDVAEPQHAHVETTAGFGYEVQYLLEAPDEGVHRLTERLADLGDSLVVAGAGDGLFNVHVHVDDVGAAIEAGIEVGRPHRISVTHFGDQLAGRAAAGRSTRPAGGVAIVAVAPGEGLADLFRSEGVCVVDGGATANPSTAEVLAGIRATGAGRVILLPNASAIGGVAELAAQEARRLGVAVAVVPTKSPVQGLAAVAVHDPTRRFEDDVIALAEAAAATRFAEVTIAVSESITYAGRCAAGDVLGLIDGEVVEIGSDTATVAVSLVSRLVAAGGELVTVLIGSAAGAATAADAVQRYLRSQHPLVEVNCYAGGQPHFPLLIGVE